VGPKTGVGGLENNTIRTVRAAHIAAISRVHLSSTAWPIYLGKHMAEVTASDTGCYAGLF